MKSGGAPRSGFEDGFSFLFFSFFLASEGFYEQNKNPPGKRFVITAVSLLLYFFPDSFHSLSP
jgi:hypothetical protein